jgi:hypothetical protein
MRTSTTARLLVVVWVAAAIPAASQTHDPEGQAPGALPEAPLPPPRDPGRGAAPLGDLEVDKRRAPDVIAMEKRFTLRERDLWRSWTTQEYGRGKCPSGLKRKGTICLPAWVSKKRYRIGDPLPAGIVLAPLPLDLARRLGSPAVGYRYGIVDGSLVKLTVASALVVDALDIDIGRDPVTDIPQGSVFNR